MRTTVDIPGDLISEAQKAANLPTKRDAIIAGLRELIRKHYADELIHLAGKIDLDIDLAKSRGRKR